MAQDEAAASEEEVGMLDEIVVTASGRDQTKIESSISVTSVNAQMIQDFQPSSEAEVFRMIPGIQVPGTSGPGGNSNIAVRGLPVATGGSPFVQIQEDGLPLLEFADLFNVGADVYLRNDLTVNAIETIRGWGENPADYVDTKLSVSETSYKAWPPAIRDLFTPARTVKPGKKKFEVALTQKEAA